MSTPPFAPVDTALDFPRYEARTLAFWKERKIFEKSLVARGPDAPHFVFYEGPPTANGVPHNGHVLTRVMKDLFPRYRAMTGARVLRKGGWDTHGLPVEVEVEKELHIHGKAAIEAYGVEPFVARCIESVFRYTADWERVTERLGFWVSLPDAYVTFHKSYVESVWWALANLFEKGLLYRGHKVVWWWPQGGTALSAAEVGLGYKSVDDPSVYVAFPLVDDPETALVVWTTTPWTLPSNGYAAVGENVEYVVARVGEAGEGKKKPVDVAAKHVIVAVALRGALEKAMGRTLDIERTLTGAELVGKRYVPPFDGFSSSLADRTYELATGGEAHAWWRVIAGDFVTLDTGTGIVHVAPAFGEDDHEAHKLELRRYARPEEIELLCAVKPDGTFTEAAGKYAGRFIKACDGEITRDLAAAGLLLASETYRHDYPFCWRADEDPLFQLARPAWFIRTTEKLDQAIANNRAVNWLPEHIKTGRFGDFLDHNVDWALSRERYWGTPLNVWVCSADPEHLHAPSSVAEIEAMNPSAFAHFYEARRGDPTLSEHLVVHKPWVDQVEFPCPKCGAAMTRVPEVIDCWFDSGCMPFAQWGFPHAPGSVERLDDAFPASFISEAIDQTRGWFYSLLMISTLVFDEATQKAVGLSRVRPFPHPYETCIVLGHVCDKEGKKESKSKGNYTPPEIILDRVRMEFGVLVDAPGVTPEAGSAFIAREDLEGMDVREGAKVALYRLDTPETKREVVLRVAKKLPRRVVVLAEADRAALALSPIGTGLGTMPVAVPRAAPAERVVIEDEGTPAPGADAFRWFFFASSPPWSNTRHSLTNVRMLQKEFAVKLRNVYSFFVIYANIDGWSPENAEHAPRPLAERSLLDRWLGSEIAIAIREIRAALDGYRVYDAAQRLVDLVDAASNWWLRRSRERFWASGMDVDKKDAHATLYAALVTLSKLCAPFIPFFAEELHQNLAVGHVAGARESVHLEDYPAADEAAVDGDLAVEMRAVRDIVSLGLAVRTSNKLKVRQPLSRADVISSDRSLLERLRAYESLVSDELNVHEVRWLLPGGEAGAVQYRVKPNFRTLGPRLGKRVQAVKRALAAADGGALHHALVTTGRATLEVEGEAIDLDPEELEVAVEASEGYAAASGRTGVVVLHTALTDELVDEGLVRELVSKVQGKRKDMKLGFTDRVELSVDGSARIVRVARAHEASIAKETLASRIALGERFDGAESMSLGDEDLWLRVRSPAPG